MNVAVVKYNAGNIHSVRLALNRLGIDPVVSDETSILQKAEKVIFPGVGEASSAMQYLRDKKVHHLLPKLNQPVLGICLGLQLMCSFSDENDTPCLDIFQARVKKFEPKAKVPHMGWNSITDLNSPLFNHIQENSYVYFVHSYYAESIPEAAAKTRYITQFSAALHKDNFYAVQFHPEKSGKVGEQILKNFLSI